VLSGPECPPLPAKPHEAWDRLACFGRESDHENHEDLQEAAMTANRVALGATVGVLAGALALTGCGGSDKPDTAAAKASASASSSSSSSPTATTSARPGTTASAGATAKGSAASAGGAQRSAVSGTLTAVRDLTATVAAPGGSVAISWTTGTVIVDTVGATARAVKLGTCVLVLPPDQGPSPTPDAITAGVVRVVDSSPSCPLIPGMSPTEAPSPGAGAGGGLTIAGGQGVIGTVSAVSRKGFTLRSRDDGKIRSVAVRTTSATEYRKAGQRPRSSIEVGRCATVWGRHHGSRLVANRIRVSDPVGGTCAAASG
jgi:hypothetical protein